MARPLVPARHRPPLPLERLILAERPNDEALDLDVLFVGAGPAGLAAAIELARLSRTAVERGEMPAAPSIGVLEKAANPGEHCLSGAVVDPSALRELFPDRPTEDLPLRGPVGRESAYLLTERRAFRTPLPPTMRNRGRHVASLCEIVRWLAERAEELGVDLFPGFPAGALLIEGERVAGVRTVPSGLGRNGEPLAEHQPATDVTAKVTVLAEGSRGLLSQAWLEWQGVRSPGPQTYALGVKELWRTKTPLSGVVHTLGWPLPGDVFGGSFAYPMEPELVSLGLVVGLDHRYRNLDVHGLLQRLKTHPLFRRMLDGGELLEWGAKTIPEGGWHALPARRHGAGLLLLGDAAGFVDVASLKGVHHAMWSGIHAARTIFGALRVGDTGAKRLADYDRRVDASPTASELRRTRNMRAAFRHGLLRGGARAWMMALTGGRFPAGAGLEREDGDVARTAWIPDADPKPDGTLTFDKAEAVFRAGNRTRDTIPSHLLVADGVGPEQAEFYAHLCPAAVYDSSGGELTVQPPNCVDCKATDVLGPRWTPREGGAGPAYRRM